MGLRTRAAIAAKLIARGWPPSTPAAIVYGASHPDSRTWIGELAALGDASFETELPAVLVIGEVVALASALGHARQLAFAAETSQALNVKVFTIGRVALKIIPNSPAAARITPPTIAPPIGGA